MALQVLMTTIQKAVFSRRRTVRYFTCMKKFPRNASCWRYLFTAKYEIRKQIQFWHLYSERVSLYSHKIQNIEVNVLDEFVTHS